MRVAGASLNLSRQLSIENRKTARFRALLPIGVALVMWLTWGVGMASGDRFHLFHDNYFMSITMLFGSFIAGATSEGGGAVAFPVMTLLFEVPPATARDFSLMIQSVGMTAAAVTILACRVRVCSRSVLLAGAGGVLGVILGLELLAGRLAPAFVKMFFTSLWLSFAVVLFWLNRDARRFLQPAVPVGRRSALALFSVGALGGVVSGITGSGVDILTFSLLVLTFRVSEAVATPTSVVLMALTAVAGATYRGVLGGGLAPAAWAYWWVCVPIVVVGAPCGARFIKSLSRQWICRLLFTCIGAQFLAAVSIIPQTATLVIASAGTFATGVALFGWMQAAAARVSAPQRLPVEGLIRPAR